MTEDRKEFLEKRVRKLTKEIGAAKKANERMDLDNFRTQRNAFLNQLAEEFDSYFWIAEGKSQFGSKEQMEEHYQDPEERKKVRGASIVSDLFAGRTMVKERIEKFATMDGPKLKKLVLDELTHEADRLETAINKIQDEIKEVPIDFEQVDKNRESTKNDLEGIDLTSLEDKK